MTLSRFLGIFEMQSCLKHTTLVNMRTHIYKLAFENLLSPLIYVLQSNPIYSGFQKCAIGAGRSTISMYMYERTNDIQIYCPAKKLGDENIYTRDDERNWLYMYIWMISCFPIYINDYRKLGSIVCGRNYVLFI